MTPNAITPASTTEITRRTWWRRTSRTVSGCRRCSGDCRDRSTVRTTRCVDWVRRGLNKFDPVGLRAIVNCVCEDGAGTGELFKLNTDTELFENYLEEEREEAGGEVF